MVQFRKYSPLLALLWLSVNHLAIAASEWVPELERPSGASFWQPQEPISISIPDAAAAQIPSLQFELDNIDITALVRVQEGKVVYQPIEPLATGEHELRLVEYSEDGDVIEKGVWTLSVRRSALFKDASGMLNAQIQVSQRVAEERLSNLPNATSASGSIQWQTQVAGDAWRATADVPIILEAEAQNLNGEHYELGAFLFTGTNGPLSVAAGHHQVGPNSLFMQDFNRRGVSMSWYSDAISTEVSGFSYHATPLTGFQRGFGVTQDTNRVSGMTVRNQAAKIGDGMVEVFATYIDGRADEGGFGVGTGAGTVVESGTGWSAGADAQFLQNRLRLRGEFARTEFDFDGDGIATPEQDDGYSMLLSYKPQLLFGDANVSKQLELGVEHREVGTYFKSAANPSAVTDRTYMGTFANMLWGSWNLQSTLGREEDNVDKSALIPTNQTRLFSLMGNYSPYEWPENWGWMGIPSLIVENTVQRTETVELPASLVGVGVDMNQKNWMFNVGSNFRYNIWSWGIRRDSNQFRDYQNYQSDFDSAGYSLDGSLALGRHNVFARVQLMETEYIDTTVIDDGKSWGLGVSGAIDSNNRWTYGVNYDVNRNQSSDRLTNSETHIAGFYLNWVALMAAPYRPGVTFTFDGNYSDTDDYVTPFATNNFQVFLKALVDLSISY